MEQEIRTYIYVYIRPGVRFVSLLLNNGLGAYLLALVKLFRSTKWVLGFILYVSDDTSSEHKL